MTEINVSNSRVQQRQAPLRKQYMADPAAAMVVDRARTYSMDQSDPFHAIVEPMPSSGESLPVGVHESLGGLHDAPTPGDILCASLASCLDSSLRMVANSLSIKLLKLEIDVCGEVDVRGTLLMNRDVPVGFQRLSCQVNIEAAKNTPESSLERLFKLAEQCCVILQTLQRTPQIETRYAVD